MWDLVGNPKDRFSHNEAHMLSELDSLVMVLNSRDAYVRNSYITITRLCKILQYFLKL